MKQSLLEIAAEEKKNNLMSSWFGKNLDQT